MELKVVVTDETWAEICEIVRYESGSELTEADIKSIVETDIYNWIMRTWEK